jgi:multiple sugar transport system substrate-binding protein
MLFLLLIILSLSASIVGKAYSQTVTIRFVHWVYRPNEVALLNKLIEEFHAANPNIKIKAEQVPVRQMLTKLTSDYAAGNAPDVSQIGNDKVVNFAAAGALHPLDSYFAKWDEGQISDFYPADRGYYIYHKKPYGSPWYTNTRVLFYRKDWFQEASIKGPPETWDEFVQIAKKLTDPSKDRWGFGLIGKYYSIHTFAPIWMSFGARLLNDDSTKCMFNSKEFEDALRFYTGLFLEHKVAPPGCVSFDASDVQRAFSQGRYAMIITAMQYLPQIAVAAPTLKDKVAVAVIPGGKAGRFAYAGGTPLVMWNPSKHKEEAWQFIAHITKKENLIRFAKVSGQLPPRGSLANDEYYRKYPYSVYLEQLKHTAALTYPNENIPQMGVISQTIIQDAIQAILAGNMTPKQAAAKVANDIDQILKKP